MPRPADWCTGLRLLLVPLVVWLGLIGQGRLVGIVLVFGGLTDFLDGHLARRLPQQSAHGAWFDSLADSLLLVASAASLEILHPKILQDNTLLIAITFGVFAASLAVGLIEFRKLGNLQLYSSKVAGGLLYSFALLTLFAGTYEPPVLALACAALIVSSAETLIAQLLSPSADAEMRSVLFAIRSRADVATIQITGSVSKHRSQIPQASNVVLNRQSNSSNPSSATPVTSEITP